MSASKGQDDKNKKRDEQEPSVGHWVDTEVYRERAELVNLNRAL